MLKYSIGVYHRIAVAALTSPKFTEVSPLAPLSALHPASSSARQCLLQRSMQSPDASASARGSPGVETAVELSGRRSAATSPSSAASRAPAAASPALPASIDRSVFDELPSEIQRELLAAHAAEAREMDEEEEEDELRPSRMRKEQRGGSDAEGGELGWACRVCTFVNHPELDECEMCETMRVDDDEAFDMQRQGLQHPPSSSGARSSGPMSAVSRSLRKIRLPATPAATALTNSAEPTADDLLIAATSKIHQLQVTASKGLQQAKGALLGGKSATSSNNSSRTQSPSGIRRPRFGSSDSSDGKSRVVVAPPSSQVALELAVLQYDLNQKCEPGNELFEGGLERLWLAVYGDGQQAAPFVREGEGWINMGFQRTNPETDFRGGGMLALKCLLYAFEAHPHEMRAILDAQKPPKAGSAKKWYPVCVAGINVTCMIAGQLKLGNGKYEETPECFWPLFEEPAAFYQLFFHAFLKMDATWRRMNASYMEFGVVLKATRQMVAHMLSQAPRTLDELRVAADRTFIDGFVVCLSSRFLADSENGECPDPYNSLEDETEIILTATRSAAKTKDRAATSALGSIWPLR